MSAEIIDLKDILQEPDVLYCYNPSNKVLEGKCDGTDYIFCPESCREPRCISQGRHNVGPGYSPVRGTSRVWKKKNVIDKVYPLSAKEIVSFLCGPDGRSGPLGIAGLRPMTGRPEQDELIRADAKKAWRQKRFMDAQTIIRAHEAKMALSKSDPNILPPDVTPQVRDAYETVQEERMAGNAPLASHPCEKCNSPFYNEHQLAVHMKDVHQVQEKQQQGIEALIPVLAQLVQAKQESKPDVNEELLAQIKALTEKVTALEARPKRGRPRKTVEA